MHSSQEGGGQTSKGKGAILNWLLGLAVILISLYV